MEVYALVGPSGTGKSHRAVLVAHQLDAEIIVDDGLIIQGSCILAGTSAKHQHTRVGAIKTALFLDQQQVEQAKKVIRNLNPKKILILATSERMAERIRLQLELPALKKAISINEVATFKEIRKARIERAQHSKHVIPAPTMEVKRRFPDSIIDPLHIFLRRKGAIEKRKYEQSVIRPTFTGYGKLFIAQDALVSIIIRACKEIDGVKSTGRINIIKQEEGVIIELSPCLYYRYPLHKLSRKIQLIIKKRVEEMTGLTVKAIHIFVKEIKLL